MANKHLIDDLMELGLWDKEMRGAILEDRKGGISENARIPSLVRDIYRTVWDMSMKDQIEHALTREVFIDQSESFSWFIPNPTPKILSQFHAYGWRRGRKTSSYYTRRLAPVDAQKLHLNKQQDLEFDSCGDKGFCGS
jgi:ribonucleoside-diphosphate reductase alpha chain